MCNPCRLLQKVLTCIAKGDKLYSRKIWKEAVGAIVPAAFALGGVGYAEEE